MTYIKIDDDRWVKINENNTSIVLSKTELEQQRAFSQEQLDGLPDVPSDEELLIWARENHPSITDTEKSRNTITRQISVIDGHLDQMQ